jgi:hypothetical protein
VLPAPSRGTPTKIGADIRKYAAQSRPTVTTFAQHWKFDTVEAEFLRRFKANDGNTAKLDPKDLVRRFLRVSALFLMAPPSNPMAYSADHARMIRLLFATADE